MKAVQARVTGTVQGVSFRWYAQEKARELGVTGWVRNETDGSVLLHAEGEDAAVDALVAWGDADAVVGRIREHLDAGADHVAVQVLPTQKRGVPDAQWRELAAPLHEIGRTG